MTDRIRTLKAYQWNRRHQAFRCGTEGLPMIYRDSALPDDLRSALRLETALENERPVLLPGERIVFTRTLPALPRIYDDGEWAAISNTYYIHELGNVCNLSPNYAAILREGLNAQLDKLGGSPYHGAMRRSIQAVLALTERYRQEAISQGRNDVTEVLALVPAQGAQTFHQALQSLRILHFCMWCEGDYHNTLGRFDQYMLPYLTHDLENNILTEDEAFELVEEFFLACNRDSDLYPGMQQGDNGQSIVLGGMTPDGENGYNLLSEMCLKASAELALIDPKINLRVDKDTPLSVYVLGTQLTRLGLGFPQYENDDVAIPGLMKLGYAQRDARDYAMAACWEFIIPGKGMDIPNIAALSFASVVQDVIRETLLSAASMEDLLTLVDACIRKTVVGIAQSVKNLYVIPSPYLSLFFDGCLEKQRDISLGCVYNNYGIHGTGVASAADALAAVEEQVFSRGLSPRKLLDAMAKDYEGCEALRHAMHEQSPKVGNDDDRADKHLIWLLDRFAEAVRGLCNERGGIFRAGTGSAMYYVWHARELGATADGRLAEEPLPANYAPSLNIRLNGPTSLIRSFTKPDLSHVINGGPLTIEFHDTVFRTADAIEKVAALVQMFVLQGGHQLQLNTVNREQLLDAQAHPEQYRSLIVRVWGWSGYFVELDKCYQDHIISRVELMTDA